jgi:hypothetical protein
MAAFVTLCEAYMGIEPHFNLWNYFCAQLQQGSDVKAAVWTCLSNMGMTLIPTFP